MISARGERSRVVPGLSLGRTDSRWVAAILNQTAEFVLERDDRVRGFVCAKVVVASTSRGVGISVIARIPNACGRSGAGRRRDGKPSGVGVRPLKPNPPRPKLRAVGVPEPRFNHRRNQRLPLNVVTQQKLFLRLPYAVGRGVMNRL